MNRDLSIDDYEYSTESESSGETETLQSVFLTNQHEKFPWKGKTRKAKIPTTGRKLPYTVWLQARRGGLAVIAAAVRRSA
jgi:hypothetical protein